MVARCFARWRAMPTNDTAERTRTTGMDKVTTATNVVTTAGAILVVGLGLTFVFIIAIVALGTLPKDQGAAVVTAALTVLGTIVGAYFGVKVGAAGRERAEAARDVESV